MKQWLRLLLVPINITSPKIYNNIVMKYSLFKIPSQLNKGLFNKLEFIISPMLKPQLYIIQCF
jgi:hypothetical protein